MKKGIVYLEQSQKVTGAFLNLFQNAAQIQHLGIQRIVAVLFLLRFLVQLIQLLPVGVDLRNAGVAQPQPVLEVDNQGDDEDDDVFNDGFSKYVGWVSPER